MAISASPLSKIALVEETSAITPIAPMPAAIRMPKNPMLKKLFRTIAPISEKNSPTIRPRGALNRRPEINTYPVTARNTIAVIASATRIITGAIFEATHSSGARQIPAKNPSNTSAAVPSAAFDRAPIAMRGTAFKPIMATIQPIQLEKNCTMASVVAPT